MSRSRSPSYSRSRSRSRSPAPQREEDRNTSLFVGNLNHDTTEQRLKEFFSDWGKIIDAKIIYDQETGRSRGFGFVKYEDARDTDEAIAEADGRMLDGRPLKCNHARGSAGRGGGGYPRGGFHPRGGFRGGPAMRGRGRYGWEGGPYSHYGPPPGFFPGPWGEGYGYTPPGGPDGYAGRGRGYDPNMHRSRRRRSPSGSPGRYSPADSPSYRGGGYPKTAKRRRDHGPEDSLEEDREVASPAHHPSAQPDSARARLSPGGARSPSPGSSSVSRSSGSSSDSDASPGRRNPPQLRAVAAGAAPPVPGTLFRKELHEAKQRESEFSARAAALEAEVEQGRAARQELEAKLEEARKKLKKAEDSAKQYRKWLGAMTDCVRNALAARQAVRAVEAENAGSEVELGLFLKEADGFLAAQKQRGRRKSKRPGSVAGSGPTHSPSSPTHLEPGEEAVPANGGSGAAAKFKPGVKFRLST